ncbi:MAG: hypothetical protein JXL80_06315 [Planctomycetes bacterium]|nr:hypothetical protein [Planctomycetota bacterium]
MRVLQRSAFMVVTWAVLVAGASAATLPADDQSEAFAWSGWQALAGPEAKDDQAAAGFEAAIDYRFPNKPQLNGPAKARTVEISGESLWQNPGDPVVAVRFSSIVLPPDSEIADVQVDLGPGVVVAADVAGLAATPLPSPTDKLSPENAGDLPVTAKSFPADRPVRWRTVAACGYNVAMFSIFPVCYDAAARTVTYYPQLSIVVTTRTVKAKDRLAVRNCAADRQTAADLVDNDSALDDYEAVVDDADPKGGTLPPGGPYDYVIITSSTLSSTFQTLADHKTARGVSATVVTTSTIYSSFTGTETGDNADSIRDFIRAAHDTWNTQYILLGGDIDQVPFRGGYGYVTSSDGPVIDNAIPTDMYYACLDGPWNYDGDSIWGESGDGSGGGDVDLYPDINVGRAPVGSAAQAAYFINKTILYETTLHANRKWGVWLGEKLDDSTWGGNSKTLVKNGCYPSGWTLTERYDKNNTWTKSQFVADLNANPHIINHNGHANATYNARLYNSDVDGLTNTHPYFMYSIGCISGNFQYSDCIAEHHVVYGSTGAFGVVMNSRYGWYWVGSSTGPSHYYDYEFWDAVFNEGRYEVGRAQTDAKVDNLYRVGSTGSFRWCHFTSNLLGDPQTRIWADALMPSQSTSVVEASPETIPDDGSEPSTISIQLRTSAGNPVTGLAGMLQIVVNGTGTSTVGAVCEPSVGTYEATFTNDTPGEKVISVQLTVDGQLVTLNDTATVTVEETLLPELAISPACLDDELGLMYFDLLFVDAQGYSGWVTYFGAMATLSGTDAGHFSAAPQYVQYLDGDEMAALVAPASYAWNRFSIGAFAGSPEPATETFAQTAMYVGEAVALQNLASGAVVARFYYTWDGADVSDVAATVTSYTGVDPTPIFTLTSGTLSSAVLNNGANLAFVGAPEIEVETEDNLDWVYQNIGFSLSHGGHKVLLTATVTDLNGNDSVTLSVAKAPDSGPGEVTFSDGPTDLQKYIVGSMRSEDAWGDLVLNVTATGDIYGQTTVQVPFCVCRLGDISRDGGVEPTDMSALIAALNGDPPPIYHPNAFDLDANGGTETTDLSIMIYILNGLELE